jgi:hypothetical protein
MAQQCMAPTVHRTDGTAVYGTKGAPDKWYSNVWHQQCTVQMTQKHMAPILHRTGGTNMYGTNSASYKWHSNI